MSLNKTFCILFYQKKYWILEGIVCDSISEYTLDPNGKAKIEEIVILPVSAWYLTYLISQQTTITTLEYRLTISYNIYKCSISGATISEILKFLWVFQDRCLLQTWKNKPGIALFTNPSTLPNGITLYRNFNPILTQPKDYSNRIQTLLFLLNI